MPSARFITIGLSHYCEKARWALDRAAIPYREERHPPGIHALVARAGGGGRTVPVLVADGQVLSDSTDILQFTDARRSSTAAAPPLYPDEVRDEVVRLEDSFDERFGPHTRRYAYHHLLDDPRMAAALADGVAARWEQVLFRALLPLLRRLMIRVLALTPEGAARSKARVDEVFDEVAERLSDGRPFLVGESFTAADLTFAALAGPLLMPDQYGFRLPPLSEMPDGFRRDVERLRAKPAGAFVLRIYAEERSSTE